VVVLCDRGVTEANKSNPRTLVNALKQFKDLKPGHMCNQLTSIIKLLEEAILTEGNEDDSRPATQCDINIAIDSIKSAMVLLPRSQAAPLSFADTVRTPAGLRTATPRLPPSAEAQEKEIFISLKM